MPASTSKAVAVSPSMHLPLLPPMQMGPQTIFDMETNSSFATTLSTTSKIACLTEPVDPFFGNRQTYLRRSYLPAPTTIVNKLRARASSQPALPTRASLEGVGQSTASVEKSNVLVQPLSTLTTRSRRRSSIAQLVTTRGRCIKQKIWKLEKRVVIQRECEGEENIVWSTKYSLDLPVWISQDKSELDCLRRKNMDAFLGINTDIPGLTELPKMNEVTEEQVTQTLYNEKITVQIQKSNELNLGSTNGAVESTNSPEIQKPSIEEAESPQPEVVMETQTTVVVIRQTRTPEPKSGPLPRRMQRNDAGFYDKDAIVSKSKSDSTRSSLNCNVEKQNHPSPVHHKARPTQGTKGPRTPGKRDHDHESEGVLPTPILKNRTSPRRNPPISKEQRTRRTKAFVLSRMGCSPSDWEPWSMTAGEFQPVIERHIKDLDRALTQLLAHEQCTGTNCGHWFRKEARKEKLTVIEASDRRRELFVDEWYGTLEEAMTKTHRAIPFELTKDMSDVKLKRTG